MYFIPFTLCFIFSLFVCFSFSLVSPAHLCCSLPQQWGERVAAGVAGAARLCSVSPAGAQHSRHSEVQRNVHSGESYTPLCPAPCLRLCTDGGDSRLLPPSLPPAYRAPPHTPPPPTWPSWRTWTSRCVRCTSPPPLAGAKPAASTARPATTGACGALETTGRWRLVCECVPS